jgi:hypothetical protein
VKAALRYIRLLLILEVLLLAAGYFIISGSGVGITFSETALLSGIFTVISGVTMVIFFRGQGKEPASQGLHSLVSVTLKFLLELITAFVWFFVAKKTGLSSVLLFFVLYLAFTLFSVLIMVKTLKNKSL